MESVQEAVASTSVSSHQGREGLAALRILRRLHLGKDVKGSTSFKNCAGFIFCPLNHEFSAKRTRGLEITKLELAPCSSSQ